MADIVLFIISTQTRFTCDEAAMLVQATVGSMKMEHESVPVFSD